MNIRKEIISAILGTEGGYVNDPKDSGGETNWGITIKVARDYGYMGPMRMLSKQTAIDIYENEYWDKMNLDGVSDISPALAYVIFDIGVNAGVRTSIILMQRFLNVMNNRGKLYQDMIVDGINGPTTMKCLRAFYSIRGQKGIKIMSDSIKAMQLVHYINLAETRQKDERFAYGWADRAFKEPTTMFA